MFGSGNDSLIQFEGWRIKRVHPETKTTSCYLCHYNGGTVKQKYTVIDRVDEDLYYYEILFNSSDRKEYDQQEALKIIALLTPKDSFIDLGIPSRKTLLQSQRWDIAKGFSLILDDVTSNSDSAAFTIEVGDRKYKDIVMRGDILEYEFGINYLGYTYTNITVFRAKVSEILQGKTTNIVVLEDIVALSPDITKIDINSTIYGYNATWLWKNNTFMIGRIPSNLHAPLMNDGKAGGPDCVSCHGTKELGRHIPINQDASSTVSEKNKPCWACHGDGKEPKGHPGQYKTPRTCKSCHVESGLTYNAPSVKEEKHSMLENCAQCHVENTHTVFRFDIVPGIKDLSISRDKVLEGDKIAISATAVAGFNMRIKAAEYYIDSPDNTIRMSAVDGSFDEQVEEISAEIDTAGSGQGTHTISVRAMELDNKWGADTSTTFTIVESSTTIKDVESEPIAIIPEIVHEKLENIPYSMPILIVSFTILLFVIWKLWIRNWK
jgi:hypothetical protein